MVWNLGRRRRSAGDELLLKHSTSAYGLPSASTSAPSATGGRTSAAKSVVAVATKPATVRGAVGNNNTFRTAAASAGHASRPDKFYNHNGQNRSSDNISTSILVNRRRSYDAGGKNFSNPIDEHRQLHLHDPQDQYHLQQHHQRLSMKMKKQNIEQPPPSRHQPAQVQSAPVSFNRSRSAPQVVTSAVKGSSSTPPVATAEEKRTVMTNNSELTERIERLERELYKSQKQQQKQQRKLQEQEQRILHQQQQQQQQLQKKKKQPQQPILKFSSPPQVPLDPPSTEQSPLAHNKDHYQPSNTVPESPRNGVKDSSSMRTQQRSNSTPTEAQNDAAMTRTRSQPTQPPLKSSVLQQQTTEKMVANQSPTKATDKGQEHHSNTPNYVDARDDDVPYDKDGENVNDFKTTSSLTPLQWQQLKKSSREPQQKQTRKEAPQQQKQNNDHNNIKKGRSARKLLSFARRPPSGVNNKRKNNKISPTVIRAVPPTSLNQPHQATPKVSNVAVSEATIRIGGDKAPKQRGDDPKQKETVRTGTSTQLTKPPPQTNSRSAIEKIHQLFSPVSDISGSFDGTEDETVSDIIATQHPSMSSSAMVCLFPNLLDTHVVEIEVGPQCNAPMNERMIGDYIGENGHCVSSPLNEGLVGDFKLSCHGATRGFERFDTFGDDDDDDDSFISKSGVPKEVKLTVSEENSIIETDYDDEEEKEEDVHQDEDVGLNGRGLFKSDGEMLLGYANEEESVDDELENNRGVSDRYSTGGGVNVNNRTLYVPLPGLAKASRRKSDSELASSQCNRQAADKLSRSTSGSDRNFHRSSSSNSRLGISPRVVEELTEYDMEEEIQEPKPKSMPPNLKIQTKQTQPSSLSRQKRPVLSPRRLFQRKNRISQENATERIDYGSKHLEEIKLDTMHGGFDQSSSTKYIGQIEDRQKVASFYDRILSLSPRSQKYQRKGRTKHTSPSRLDYDNGIAISEYQAQADWVQDQRQNLQETAPEDDWQPTERSLHRPLQRTDERDVASGFNADWQQPNHHHHQHHHQQQQQQLIHQRHHDQHPSHAMTVRSEQNSVSLLSRGRSQTQNRSRSRSRSRSPSKFFNDLLRMKPTNDDIIEDLLQLEEKFPEVSYA